MTHHLASWRAAIAEFSEWGRLHRYPPATIRTRSDHLQQLAKGIEVGPWELTGDELLHWFAAHDWAANTYRSKRTTMRAFYRWAMDAEFVVASPANVIPKVDPPPPNPMPCPDRVYDNALLDADDRLQLMLELAAGHGLRRGEVTLVWPERDLVEDLDGWSLIVHGKGGKTRIVPLEATTAMKLLRAPAGYAFPGRIDGHLSPQRVGNLVSRALEGGWTMHKLRHRAGTNMAEASGGDMRVVQELLGHAGLNTTMLYVKVNQKRWRAAVNAGYSTRAAAQERQYERRMGENVVVPMARHDGESTAV
ncbi:tyrosine-type recombinase/integrase [Nocardioides baekrokdamisoli]|uniref:tyrosine-type recombinase/integrase n=1 Tax=Nocardioides baekrokdamisoli TaxID=1804624 RepID=UPI0013DDFF97|nr:tyrosine-type recombinase/integrase [Nocardioides baekrokdamisoli]